MNAQTQGKASFGFIALGWAVLCLTFLATPAYAEDALFEGVFENRGVVLEFRSAAEPHTYTGTIHFQGNSRTVNATAAGTGLVGTCQDGPRLVKIRGELKGDQFTLMFDGKSIPLIRRAGSKYTSNTPQAPPKRVLDATFNFLQFRMGLLYDHPTFKMEPKHEQALKLKIRQAWPTLSATQRRTFSEMPAHWKKLQGQWNALNDAQKKTFAKQYQKKWLDETNLKARKETDPKTRDLYRKQIADYLLLRKKIAQAKEAQANATGQQTAQSKQKKQPKSRSARSHTLDPSRGLRIQTQLIQAEMLNQSYRDLQIARSWD